MLTDRALPQRPRPSQTYRPPADAAERRAVRDGVRVLIGGQIERALGIFTALALRWWLDPTRLGVYAGLRLFLDNTNRSSLGVGLGAVQEMPLLRASGREAEARHVANVAHTTNTITCALYAVGLIGWALWTAAGRAASPLAAEWTWGLVAVAGLSIVKRYESFLIAVLRSHQEFALTTQVDVLESLVSAAAVSVGLLVAGFWGLLASIAVILTCKIAYLHAHHPYRFGWAWDWPCMWRLMVTGLPILANTAVFGCVVGLDRVLILRYVPDGARALGLYSVAIMGTGSCMDLTGRIVLVIYPYLQTALGRGDSMRDVAQRALRATEAQAPLLACGAMGAFVFGPALLTLVVPRYAAGVVALRPLLPGMVLLSLAWPARQMLIAIGRPYRLFVATTIGLVIVAVCGWTGARLAGLVGVAGGVSIGFGCVYLLTSLTALGGFVGLSLWLRHLVRLCTIFGWCVAGSWLALALSPHESVLAGLVRALVLCLFAAPLVARAFWTIRQRPYDELAHHSL
jgi:O-antigen/teichoic acid export membrane protein